MHVLSIRAQFIFLHLGANYQYISRALSYNLVLVLESTLAFFFFLSKIYNVLAPDLVGAKVGVFGRLRFWLPRPIFVRKVN